MKTLFIISLFLLAASCKPCQTITETLTVEKEIIVFDTIVEFQVQSDTVTITQLVHVTESGLPYTSEMYFRETEFCEVWAHVDKGIMNVKLMQKDKKIEQLLNIPVEKETITVTKFVQVERDFTWWQKTLMALGGSLILAVIILLVFKFK